MSRLLNWLRRKPVPPSHGFTVHGPPVSRELRQVFGQYALGEITGIIVLPEGIVVTYLLPSGGAIQITFAAYHSGGTIGRKPARPTR